MEPSNFSSWRARIPKRSWKQTHWLSATGLQKWRPYLHSFRCQRSGSIATPPERYDVLLGDSRWGICWWKDGWRGTVLFEQGRPCFQNGWFSDLVAAWWLIWNNLSGMAQINHTALYPRNDVFFCLLKMPLQYVQASEYSIGLSSRREQQNRRQIEGLRLVLSDFGSFQGQKREGSGKTKFGKLRAFIDTKNYVLCKQCLSPGSFLAWSVLLSMSSLRLSYTSFLVTM